MRLVPGPSTFDVFTLGIVLAEMLILRPLFSGGKELDVLLRIRDIQTFSRAKNAASKTLACWNYERLRKGPDSRVR